MVSGPRARHGWRRRHVHHDTAAQDTISTQASESISHGHRRLYGAPVAACGAWSAFPTTHKRTGAHQCVTAVPMAGSTALAAGRDLQEPVPVAGDRHTGRVGRGLRADHAARKIDALSGCS
jgi:hypothetical protein